MIFISKNEKGEPAWKLVLEGKKTVTRRLKPLPVGKEFAVQPGRGKFSVCRAIVTSCMSHKQWLLKINGSADFNKEAKKEGFYHWETILKFFDKKCININCTYRIKFKKLGAEL